MASEVLKLSLSPHSACVHRPSTSTSSCSSIYRCSSSSNLLHQNYRRHRRHRGTTTLHSTPPTLIRRRNSNLFISNAVELRSPIDDPGPSPEQYRPSDSAILLDVTGMMCGACVSRVKGLLSADNRVESAVVNMLTETAAVKLKSGVTTAANEVAGGLARRLTECGFEAKRRVAGTGVAERVNKWKESMGKKEQLLQKSRNRVVFAWTLVVLCCGSHASHILHSFGIHIAHGGVWDVLHNSYVKGGLAMGALLGPGRDLLYDGIRAFAKGSPNMNSLVGFGSVAAFLISAVSLLNPEFEWNASFFDEPVMLLGFVLLGRSLEEKARITASSDMNELLSLISTQSRLVIASSDSDVSTNSVISSEDNHTISMAAGSKSVLLWLALLAVVVFVISSESVIARELAENSNGAQLEQHSAEALGEEKIPRFQVPKWWPKKGPKPSDCPLPCCTKVLKCDCCDK